MLNRRADAGVLSPPQQTSNGVVYEARVASTAPLTYRDVGGGSHLERRTLDELRRLVDQLPGAVVTLDHPDTFLAEGGDHVRAGVVESARIEHGDGVDHAVARIRVTDQRTLDAIDRGERGISLGYSADVSQVDDDGVRLQQNCKLDHVAIVATPRCTSCELRGDRVDCAGARDCGCGCTDEEIDNWDPIPYRAPSAHGDTMSTKTDESDTDEQAAAAALARHSRNEWRGDQGLPSATRQVDPHDLANRNAPYDSRAGRAKLAEAGGWAQGGSLGATAEQVAARKAELPDGEEDEYLNERQAAREAFDRKYGTATARMNDAMDGGSVYDQVAHRAPVAAPTATASTLPADSEEDQAKEFMRAQWRAGKKE